MSDVRVEAFPIPGLEYVFVPPGLPLISKTRENPATTSILIRGAAGIGKTTLAVALAHAIAREQGGVTLYLTTEFVATELKYKAKTLGMPEGSVGVWRSRRACMPGSILAEHLVQTAAGDDIKTIAERKRAAIQAVWELLEQGSDASSAEGHTVRAAVIDAFGLPEVGQEDKELRNELVALIQTLELSGITPILVEEAGAAAEAWLPFVVDVVFELEMWADPENGELLRRLKCPKSRYTQALAGPHDYGLDHGRPSLWPDLIPAGGTYPSLQRTSHPAPAVFFPLGKELEYAVCPAGSVLVSEYDKSSPIIRAFLSTPGIQSAAVDCGPLTRVSIPGRSTYTVPESEGPLSLAWSLLRTYNSGAINSVRFQGLEFFLSRRRLQVGALHMIEMLRSAGMTICIHGRSAELAKTTAVADFMIRKRSARISRTLPSQRPCSSVRWIGELYEQARITTPRNKVQEIKQHMVRGAFSPEALLYSLDQLAAANPPPEYLEIVLERAFALHLLGADSWVDTTLSMSEKESTSSAGAATAWTLFHLAIGDDLGAVRTCLYAEFDLLQTRNTLWRELSAIYARNDVAMADLAKAAPDDTRSLAALLRALAVREQFEPLQKLVDARGAQLGLPPWFLARLKADAYLEALNPAALQQALAPLEQLTRDEAVPPVHRAEVCYNLGVARSRLGDAAGARASYQEALALNPHLEAASQALAGRAGE